ncbi:hypothetical protein PMAYCL1PPCAC_24966, partial [Pristionchus mayeri]
LFISRMADNSDIILRWGIDNPMVSLATGKIVSKVLSAGGFRWSVSATKEGNLVPFVLNCGFDHSRPWKCEVDVVMSLVKANGEKDNFTSCQVLFDESNCTNRLTRLTHKALIDPKFYNVNNMISTEFHISIISSEREEMPSVDSAKFTAPNRRSDVILKIGEKKLHASKEFLAVHSPVFETLFFGNFAEKDKGEVEINDVVYEEFVDLLHLLHLGPVEINDHTVSHIMKLAERFQIQTVLERSAKHLTQSSGFDAVKILGFADQHRLPSLRDHCLNSFTSLTELASTLNTSPDFANFSDGMKGAICERMTKLA